MADMCLDLAVQDKARAPKHVATARDTLAEIVDEITVLEESGYAREASRLKPVGIQAALRATEVDNWGRAAVGQQVGCEYETLLQGALVFDPLDVAGGGHATLIEFMPVLLGARAIRSERPGGSLARLALLREEGRDTFATGTNPNWDTGILLNDTSAEFLSPSVRVNLKTSTARGTQKYREGGVQTLNASTYGISNPAQIIYSCLNEIEDVPSGIDMLPPLLDSHTLDKVTLRLHDTLVLPALESTPLQEIE